MKTNKSKNPHHAVSIGPKIFDVARPGKALPGSSGRPLIVTDRPMVLDPMMTKPRDSITGTTGTPVMRDVSEPPKPAKITLQPDPEALQELPKLAVAQGATTEKAAPGQSQELEQPDKAIPDTQAVTTKEPDQPELPVLDNVVPATEAQVPEAATKPDSAAPETSQSTEPEPPVASEAYHVHISSPPRGRTLRLAVIGAALIIVVAIGCVDAMLDAGAMTVKGLPHTHFIRQ